MATRHAPWRGLSSGRGLLPVHRYKLPAGCRLPESAGGDQLSAGGCDTPAGEWQSDHQHGQGKARWIDGSAYDGTWARGVRYAPQQGRHCQLFEQLFLWSEQLRTAGRVCRAGHGVLVRVDGYKYDGSWQDDAEKGTGEGRSGASFIVTSHPCTFAHQFRNHVVCSPAGNARFANGDRFSGQFKDGKPHGKGRMQSADGGRYEGDWADGKRNGQGRCIFANGDKYQGL